MRQRFSVRWAWLSLLPFTLLLGSSLVHARQVEAPLQGHLLERSDGSLFVYKDGQRYPIQPAALSDDDIDNVPLASPVDRLDQLFSQPPPTTGGAGSSSPNSGSDNAPFPAPGTLLYQADWSAANSSWALPSDWQVGMGILSNTGANREVSDMVAPYQPPSIDYAVEAEIQSVKYQPPIGWTAGFGLIFRGDGHGEFHAGIVDIGRTASISAPAGGVSVGRSFTPGNGWRTYRLEAKASHMRLLIDGVDWVDADINPIYALTTPTGRVTGLWAQSTQLNVRSFKVFAL